MDGIQQCVAFDDLISSLPTDSAHRACVMFASTVAGHVPPDVFSQAMDKIRVGLGLTAGTQ